VRRARSIVAAPTQAGVSRYKPHRTGAELIRVSADVPLWRRLRLKRHYLLGMRRWWLAVLCVCMCALAACSSKSQSAPSGTTASAHLSSAFCSSLRQAWRGPSFNTSDTVTPDQFASDVIRGYRRELLFLQSAYASAPSAVARQMMRDVATIRAIARLDPNSAADRSEATHLLSSPGSAADRVARGEYLGYASYNCQVEPPIVQAPGGQSVSASTSTS
jgi:hypothetical protein